MFLDAHETGLSATLTEGDATHPFAFDRPDKKSRVILRSIAIGGVGCEFRSGVRHYIIMDHLDKYVLHYQKGSIRTDWIKMRHQDVDAKMVWWKGKSNPAEYPLTVWSQLKLVQPSLDHSSSDQIFH